MTLVCTVCGYDQNPNNAEYCDACGAELTASAPPPPLPVPSPSWADDPVVDTYRDDEPPSSPVTTSWADDPIVNTYRDDDDPFIDTFTHDSEPSFTPPTTPTTATPAKLVSRQPNSPIPEFPLDSSAVIGVFDSDTGPVEIDLESFLGNETVSRNHAEIYPENGVWKIKDLGSTNGVFIKPYGQSRFNARITAPTTLNNGDEIAIAKIRFLFQTS